MNSQVACFAGSGPQPLYYIDAVILVNGVLRFERNIVKWSRMSPHASNIHHWEPLAYNGLVPGLVYGPHMVC